MASATLGAGDWGGAGDQGGAGPRVLSQAKAAHVWEGLWGHRNRQSQAQPSWPPAVCRGGL